MFSFEGISFNETNRTYKAEGKNLHITFRETRREAIFHDKANSANCSCMEGNDVNILLLNLIRII